jgi:exonuclease III
MAPTVEPAWVRSTLTSIPIDIESEGSYVAAARTAVFGRERTFVSDLASRGWHDCHWGIHQHEFRSVWRKQDRNPYQCDHAFTDVASSQQIADCKILPYEPVRELSDHSPLLLVLAEGGPPAAQRLP